MVPSLEVTEPFEYDLFLSMDNHHWIFYFFPVWIVLVILQISDLNDWYNAGNHLIYLPYQ
jgi:hypothetical protein